MSHINKLEILLSQPSLFTFLERANRAESQRQFLDIFEKEHQRLHSTKPVAVAAAPEPAAKKEPDAIAARIRSGPIRHSSVDDEQQALQESGIGDSADYVRITCQPKSIKNGQLKDYQLEGVSWILSLYQKNLNGILADEMGLGKTIQTITAIAELEELMTEEERLKRTSFYLVIVPKITLYNWDNEFRRWLPSARVFKFYGSKEEREAMKNKELKECKFDVIVTTYDIVRKDTTALCKLKYDLLIVDEAHNIKNSKSVLSQTLRKLNSRHRLLLTGTPLQNNLQELWSLLNFIMPTIFDSAIDFNETFKIDSTNQVQQEGQVVKQIHRLLRPFMLRRLKAEVEHSLLPKKEMYLYFGMTKLQRKIYKNILKNHSHVVNGNGDRVQLLNILMQLKKVCNHPYLFDGVEAGPPFVNGEHLIKNCMKFRILDQLLPRLKKQGSKVIIFSQMTSLMDILDDYIRYRGYTYCRIDGQTSALDRELRIEDFQRPDSDKFIFILSTRAGGCGISLHAANAVVLYDSDWNPQVDLQAIDRAHRIGQTREVTVYRFVTEGTVEEKIVERAARRLKMENLIMKKGRFNAENKVSTSDIIKIIQFGAQKLIAKGEGEAEKPEDEEDDDLLIEDEIERIIEYSEGKAVKLNKEMCDLEHRYDLNSFTINSRHDHNMYVFDGENYYSKKKDEELLTDDKIEIIDFGAREHKLQNYDVNKYYQRALNIPTVQREKKRPIGWRQQANGGYDHQFFNVGELDKLEEKEQAWKDYAEQIKLREEAKAGEPVPELPTTKPDEFTEEDQKRKETLMSEGLANWSKKDFAHFIRGCEKYMRGIRGVDWEGRATTRSQPRSRPRRRKRSSATPRSSGRRSTTCQTVGKTLKPRIGSRFVDRITKGESEIEKVQRYEDIIEEKFGPLASNLAIDEIPIDYGKVQSSQQQY